VLATASQRFSIQAVGQALGKVAARGRDFPNHLPPQKIFFIFNVSVAHHLLSGPRSHRALYRPVKSCYLEE
jgi:hypothetical protein